MADNHLSLWLWRHRILAQNSNIFQSLNCAISRQEMSMKVPRSPCSLYQGKVMAGEWNVCITCDKLMGGGSIIALLLKEINFCFFESFSTISSDTAVEQSHGYCYYCFVVVVDSNFDCFRVKCVSSRWGVRVKYLSSHLTAFWPPKKLVHLQAF